MKSKLRVSVRSLVEYSLRSGDLDLTSFGSGHVIEAIRAHQKIQKSRPKEYSQEVSVHHQVETENYILEISGRIDGLYTYPDRVIIDEIKTTKKDLRHLSEIENELHWGQVKCYAYIYALQKNLREIEAQLTYYHLEKEETTEVRRSFDIASLHNFFNSLVSKYLDWTDTVFNWTDVRDDSIWKLPFPFEVCRPGQKNIIGEVGYVTEEGGQLLIQAPTGIGKTMAVVFPSIKAIVKGKTSKIFFLTARTTGRTAAEDALGILRKNGLRLKSISLTAKEKLCFNTEKLCTGSDCEFAKGYFDRINRALRDAFAQDSFTRDTIISTARKHRVCPFEFSLDLSLWVDCVIGDYNYAFDPRVYLKRFFENGGDEYLFLVDEAHNLVNRAREMYSAELSKQQILELRRLLKGRLPKIYNSLGKMNAWMAKARKKCEQEGNPNAEKELPQDMCSLLRQFSKVSEEWLSLNQATLFQQKLVDFYFEVRRFLRTAERYDDNYATCYTKIGKDMNLKLFCIDPSRHLKGTLERTRTSIFFSATLNPMEYFIESLGCDESASTLVLRSPFERDNLCVLIAGRISALYKHRQWTKFKVAQAISSLIDQKKGNYLIYFPSYEYMKMIYEIFRLQCPHTNILVQSAHMSEHEREMFIEEFNKASDDHLVGFAVMGGIFAESIDLLGDRLTGAVIVGVGLPPVSLETELIREYFDNVNGSGYAFAYQYPGMIKVLQAAGRVIRSETDRGAVLLIDTRFTNTPYISLLPQDWNITNIENVNRIGEVLHNFWYH